MSILLHIPVCSERVRQGRTKAYLVHPAFPVTDARSLSDFAAINPREDRALDELTRILRKELNALAKEMRHDALVRWSFHPEATGRKIPVHLTLRKQSVQGEVFVVIYRAMGRRVVTIPKLPGIAFDLERGQRIEERTAEVLTTFFRSREKESDEKPDFDRHLTPGTARLTTIELLIRTRQVFVKPEPRGFALLGGGEKMSGAQELETVGRCLNRLYPHRLKRAILRESQVDAISEHFRKEQTSPEPLLLVGPGQAGKSAIIQEFLSRRIAADEKPVPEVWLISPQRMISGMSYIGQWEERAHAIFQEARKRKHILLFDDLTGLFQAGKSRDSDLTLGHVLKAYFEEGGLRVVAEATPESWRKLREIDRGFADFFRTLPVEETSQRDTLRILIRTIQELESRDTELQFEPDLIPTVYELQDRFSRTRAFPGKAVEVIQQLAHKYRRRNLGSDDAYAYFETKTGIRREFLRPGSAIDAQEIASFFNERIKGQPEAIEAMTDLVIRCLSQLNEPGRPMGSLLFLGPTGVGKTECAKALAEYFFGTAERLLRFDMNEFVGPDATGRLIGSPFRPRGLLTAGVRRQPFSVILLDEIEKAHPRVFDLLLQMLGDGRLTDSTGETADFCNTVVVMTSNLGARSARHQLGFGQKTRDDGRVYREAAEKFFRPELFNRLDHLVPFGELSREDIESLVALMSDRALSRIGLSETQLNLRIQPDVYSRLAEMGFKPEFGARALRRSVEENLIEPIALQIFDLPKNKPAVVSCSCDDEGGLKFASSDLTAAPSHGHFVEALSLSRCEEFVGRLNRYLSRIEDDLEAWRDESDGIIDPTDPVQMRYFSIRENIMALRRMRDHFSVEIDKEEKHRKHHPEKPSPRQIAHNHRFLENHDPSSFLVEMYQASDANRFFTGIIESAEPFEHLRQIATDLTNRANSLGLSLSREPGDEQRCLIHFTGPDHIQVRQGWIFAFRSWLDGSDLHRVAEYYLSADGKCREYDDSHSLFTWDAYWESVFLVAEGPAVFEFLKRFDGTCLVINHMGKTLFADLGIVELPPEAKPKDFPDWLEHSTSAPRYEVTTILSRESGYSLDLSSGFADTGHGNRIWNFLNPHLPVVEELNDFVSRRK